MSQLYRTALDELGAVFDRLDDADVDRAVVRIAAAKRIVVFGGGRVLGFLFRNALGFVRARRKRLLSQLVAAP